MITTLSPDLTTPVPEALIQRLNLHPGSQLDWRADTSDENVIHVTVSQPSKAELVRRLHELGAKHRKPGMNAVADLIREREEEHEMREAALNAIGS